MQDKDYLQLAIDQANKSVFEGGFPAGAIIVKDGKIIGEGISIGNILHDPTSHGETQCVRNACKNIQSSDLGGATLYASMETCAMCLNSCMWAGIRRIVFALSKDKLSNLYYGGNYTTADINTLFLKPMDIVQMKELEEASMKVVSKWETAQEKISDFKTLNYKSVFLWRDEPNTKYKEHSHKGKVSMYILDGEVTFTSGFDKTLKKGDTFDVPVGVLHTAIVGENGCEYVVGEEIEGDS